MRLTWFSLTALAAAILVSGTAEMARGPDPSAAAARLIAASSVQASLMALMAPVHALWAFCGLAGGLVLRDRVPLRGSHSSPTAAWLAKRMIAGSAVAMAAFGLGALRIDAGWMHAAAIVQALGWLVYLRNLPARL
jgi:hypothetical protein